ncbi:MAG: hypothetical protein K8F92_11520 [Hyphomicrobium sp.]|uniref:hypothetical protein n=1 Tax=Hyphomicrobium sp. TaxID=82 RepID=UPI00132CBBE6|nr:hypothetical protein [Hyphomicrobium sp.]KAB2941541.1 MAG: hypothetical protein F9K20_09110 [Hyphomicrobium sp.]MBZ0210268.1 hypothetical protein [Hyphomicrobium sp.]
MAARSVISVSSLAAAFLGALVLAGCQSPMYSRTPDDMNAPYQDRSYVGGQPTEERPLEASPDAEQEYEYRGGRDPVTGRAKTQM